VKISPTLLTAALAGMFSAIVWPLLFARFNGAAGGTFEVVLITLLVIALPAHAFVVGFGRSPTAGGRTLDTELLKRVAAWLLAAAVTAGAAVLLRPYLG
jgi:hypothetical protein